MKMKRMFLPMMALFMMLSGCTKEYITLGSQIETYRFNITPSQWKVVEGENLPGSNNYLYCTVDVPAITNEVFDYGTVEAYVWNIYDVSQNLGAWNTLPFVYPLEVYITDEQGNTHLEIEPENLRFEWEKGAVTFIIQELDGYDPMRLNQTLSFKVCVSRNL
jgi:hypothetical protein